jgi:hypothetical protein
MAGGRHLVSGRLWCFVVFTAEVLENDEAEVGYKDGDNSRVHSCDQVAGWQELFASPEEKCDSEQDPF